MSNKGKKKCKSCKAYFKPQRSTTEVVCSYSCALEYAKQLKRTQQKDLNKAREEIVSLRKINKLNQKLSHQIKLTTKVVHEYIRLRDKGKKCITCNSLLIDNYDAGHCYHASKSNALRFDFDNIHGQCMKCNRYEDGKFEVYINNLPDRIGRARFNALMSSYKFSLKYIHKWDAFALKEIRQEVAERIKEFKNKII